MTKVQDQGPAAVSLQPGDKVLEVKIQVLSQIRLCILPQNYYCVL